MALSINTPNMQEKVQGYLDQLKNDYASGTNLILEQTSLKQLENLFMYLDKIIQKNQYDTEKEGKIFEGAYNYARAIFEAKQDPDKQADVDKARTSLKEQLDITDRQFTAGVENKFTEIKKIWQAGEKVITADASIAEDNEKVSQFFNTLLANSDGDFIALLDQVDKVLPKLDIDQLKEQAHFGDTLTEILSSCSTDGVPDMSKLAKALKGDELTDVQKAKLAFHSQFARQSLSFAKELGEKLTDDKFTALDVAIKDAGAELPETREGKPRSLELNAFLAKTVKEVINAAETLAARVGGDFDHAGFYKDTMAQIINQLNSNDHFKGRLTQEDLADVSASVSFAKQFSKADGKKDVQASLLTNFMKGYGGIACMLLLTVAAEPLSKFFGMFGPLGRPVQMLLSQAHQHASSLVTATVMGKVMSPRQTPPVAEAKS